ncbi:MAG: hypothetical protein LBV50_13130, partial [Novosphingobium sp.]|nr:hypothetical protein [Novosphingobium sp.]
MAKLVQTITVKVNNKADYASRHASVKKLKNDLAPHGIGVASHVAIEAGPASGYATLSFSFPSAGKWAEFVDSQHASLQEFRKKLAENNDEIVSTSLLQEV